MNVTRSFTQRSRSHWGGSTVWEASNGNYYFQYQPQARRDFTLDETYRKTLNLSQNFNLSISATGYKPNAYAVHSSTLNLNGDLSGTISATTYSHGDGLGYPRHGGGGYGGGGCPPYALYNSKIYGDSGNQNLTINATANSISDTHVRSYAVYQSSISLDAGSDHLNINSTAVATRNRPYTWERSTWQTTSEADAYGAYRSTIDMGSGNDTLNVHAEYKTAGFAAISDATASNRSNEAYALWQSNVYLGDGDDSASITIGTSKAADTNGRLLNDGTSAAMFNSRLDAGSGDDDILIGTMRDSRINLGDGNDSLTCYGSQSQTGFLRSTIDGGAGIDQLVINTSRWDELVAAKDSRLNQLESLYGQGGAFGRQGLSAEQSYFARQFDIQNKQLGSVGNDRSDSFTWQGGTFTNFEQIAVAGAIFDTSTSSFLQ